MAKGPIRLWNQTQEELGVISSKKTKGHTTHLFFTTFCLASFFPTANQLFQASGIPDLGIPNLPFSPEKRPDARRKMLEEDSNASGRYSMVIPIWNASSLFCHLRFPDYAVNIFLSSVPSLQTSHGYREARYSDQVISDHGLSLDQSLWPERGVHIKIGHLMFQPVSGYKGW